MSSLPVHNPRFDVPLRDPAWHQRLFWIVFTLLLLWPLTEATEFRPSVLFETENMRISAEFIGSFFPPVLEPDLLSRILRETWKTVAIATAAAGAPQLQGSAQRMFDQACAACHHDGNGPRVLGVNVPLALNTNLHSERPDNLLRSILEGVQDPATRDIGFMPAFKDALDDRQLVELAAYMRQRFAPQQPAWADLPAAVARARAASVRP